MPQISLTDRQAVMLQQLLASILDTEDEDSEEQVSDTLTQICQELQIAIEPQLNSKPIQDWCEEQWNDEQRARNAGKTRYQ